MDDQNRPPRIPQDISAGELEGLFEKAFNEVGPGETQISPEKGGISGPLLEEKMKEALIKAKPRSKTSLRMKYEAEVATIIKTYGNLEEIRSILGLSQRKICQLLMVDPSAWSRWTKPSGKAPPHIYRALEWYLILQDKNPEFKSSLWLNTVARPQLTPMELESIKKKLIESSKGELTQKASFYLEEERLNRLSLKNQLEKKIQANTRMKLLVYALLASQITLAIGVILK